MSNQKKPFKANDTNKEEQSYYPFKGAKLDFIKDLEKEEENKNG